MNYTLRIINQKLVGAEERKNFDLGISYNVLMKVPSLNPCDGLENEKNQFLRELSRFCDNNHEGVLDEKIVGFIYSQQGVCYPISFFNVVYIVGENGQTIERIYGQYEKN